MQAVCLPAGVLLSACKRNSRSLRDCNEGWMEGFMAQSRAAKKAAAKKRAPKQALSGRVASSGAGKARKTSPGKASGSGASGSEKAQRTPKPSPRKPASAASSDRPPSPALFYRLNTLLHTVRVIASHEDGLCTLLHEIKTHGTATPALLADLLAQLDEMPSADYADELAAVRDLLSTPAGAPRPRNKRLP